MTEAKERSVSEIYSDGMINLAAYYISRYQQDGERMIDFVKESLVAQEVLCTVYNYRVAEGLKPIEDLAREEKESLWKESGKNLITCKALYILKEL